MATAQQQTGTVLARDLLPVARAGEDRLPPMLFVATLFYALVILGISFDIGMVPDSTDATPLEVTIVASNTRAARPDDADYLAQANQQGNGNTREKVRPGAAPTAPGQVPVPLERVGPVQIEAAPGDPVDTALLATDADAERRVYRPEDVSDRPEEIARVAQALPSGTDIALPLPEEDDPSLLITSDNPRHLAVSVNSQRSDVAPYLNSWKRRVERLGTLNFPNEARMAGMSGSPTLEVGITPDGALSEVRVLRSSGFVALDQAAIAIVTRAAPFAEFPPQVRENYDQLRIACKFEFRGGALSGTVSAPGGG